MAHYKLILAYEGSAYHGFQRQQNRHSVQAEFESALRKLGWQGRAVMPAGRTDSGVHARGQVISFSLDWKHGTETLVTALNAHLPADIAVQAAEEVPLAFHPRYDALSRTYRYQVYAQRARNPLVDRFSWRLNCMPDLEKMNRAAGLLVGEHDFRAFGKALKEDATTMRKVFSAEWQGGSQEAAFDICGNAFLYHMVRRIVFIVVQIGLGNLPEEIVSRGLESGETGIVSLAPARGLTLWEVAYPEDGRK
ncbi:MAG TPA: tRNA pseudouridine(38-40) synthase TruA [Anaerolineaceae bacterium]|nr:tRNA pseudouridine(38-40) synthase TruA [Anaerolineaceae bacterium]HPS32854.1 tRNA pseudouridine(38-40) synthase TruA [Anaerolineaceae bacterium]